MYALVDAQDRIRYVGKTVCELDVRLAWHLSKPTNWRMRLWLRAELPTIRLITFARRRDVDRAEVWWIAWCRARGRLLNVDPGGRYRGARGKVRPGARRFARAVQRRAFAAAGSSRAPRKRRHRPTIAELCEMIRRSRASSPVTPYTGPTVRKRADL